MAVFISAPISSRAVPSKLSTRLQIGELKYLQYVLKMIATIPQNKAVKSYETIKPNSLTKSEYFRLK